jgi:hypothetical protein
MAEDAAAPVLVSCLCVTEDRQPFLPWLFWNYDKQDHPRRELVIVDSSPEPLQAPDRDDVRVVSCPSRTIVSRKRNLAIEASRGTAITWFDDDDWQHPEKLSILAGALAGDAPWAGPVDSWFVDLDSGGALAHHAHRHVIFNGLGVRRDALKGVRFEERRRRAEDSAWMLALRCRARCVPVVIAEVLCFWLCHQQNISNPARRYVFPQPLTAVRDAVGPSAWQDTDEQLAGLRARVRDA